MSGSVIVVGGDKGSYIIIFNGLNPQGGFVPKSIVPNKKFKKNKK